MTFESWKSEIDWWKGVTDLKVEQHGQAVALSLDSQKREVAKELKLEELNQRDGLEKLLTKLKTVFDKEATDVAYDDYIQFETMKRDDCTNMSSYIVNFDRAHAKLAKHNMVISDTVLACKLLHSANIDRKEKMMVLATTPNLDFLTMKASLKRIFAEATSSDK